MFKPGDKVLWAYTIPAWTGIPPGVMGITGIVQKVGNRKVRIVVYKDDTRSCPIATKWAYPEDLRLV